VTGAGAGIGRAIADAFVEAGARVVYADRDGEAARAAAAEAGASALAVTMDISDEQSVEAGYATAESAGFAVDVVVANAGIQLFGHDAKTADLDLDVWRATIDVNLTGTFLTVKHAVRSLLSRGVPGSIICTGSPTGLNGEGSDFAAYSSSKGGIHSLVRATAMAYAGDGIRVNTVVPGYTETGLVTTISSDSEARAGIVGRTPLGRAGTPADVTGIMTYLAGDEASFATGAIFRVDGGMTSL
jgi:NAD(P)-dependent dehydrogenase (short-subunit alcohol dehydrogenase family)